MEERNEMEQEVMAAERAVNEAKERLAAELEAASANGRQAIERVVERARPMALAAAAVAGVVVLAGTVTLIRGSFSRSRPRLWAPPRQRSALGQAARQAFVSAAGTIAAALARRALVSWELMPADGGHTEPEPHGNSRNARPKRVRPEPAKVTG